MPFFPLLPLAMGTNNIVHYTGSCGGREVFSSNRSYGGWFTRPAYPESWRVDLPDQTFQQGFTGALRCNDSIRIYASPGPFVRE